MEEKDLKIAKVVVNTLNPDFWLFLALVIGCYFTFPTWGEILKWTFFYFVLMVVPPQIYIEAKRRYFLRQKDKEIHDLFRGSKGDEAISSLLLFLPVAISFYFITPPRWFLALYFSLIGITILSFIINYVFKFKSSYHLVYCGTYLTSIWFFIRNWTFFFLPLAALLSVAKNKIGHHTAAQLIVGFSIGIVVTALVFTKMVGI
ncbi:MAG TPA: hypothetical protein PLL80_00105 [Candidatus Pacearchaeota archaeon]|nr:hypothetical protein [Candidatus Pacearchaeota archaeon]HOK93936.1 hypothetical protein [Candidatus Pacearchaeota archaeon]HPO75007.1 hypothetical protein [Candidatus Pacearchaeota archaeon]